MSPQLYLSQFDSDYLHRFCLSYHKTRQTLSYLLVLLPLLSTYLLVAPPHFSLYSISNLSLIAVLEDMMASEVSAVSSGPVYPAI